MNPHTNSQDGPLSSAKVLAAQHIWAELPTTPLGHTLWIPGAKSETNRLLALGSLLPPTAPLQLYNPSPAADTQVLANALEQLGALQRRADQLLVHAPQAAASPSAELNLGLAGTAVRFLAAAACFWPGAYTLTGEARLLQRPLRPLLACLQNAGAQLSTAHTPSGLPVQLQGDPHWRPRVFTFPKDEPLPSSQFLSAVLLLAPRLPLGAEIHWTGPTPSRSYLAWTQHLLHSLGYTWRLADTRALLVQQTQQHNTARTGPRQHTVAADWSSASYPLALLVLRGGELQLPGLELQAPQGDAWLWRELDRRWPWLQLSEESHGPSALPSLKAQVQRPAQQALPAFELDCTSWPDQAQTLAVLATFANGPCLLTGLGTLAHKETDRLAALAQELPKLGAAVERGTDWLRIRPQALALPPPDAAAIATYNDHRMALAFSLAAVHRPGISLLEPGVVRKSWPAWWAVFQQLGGQLVVKG